VRFIGHVAYDQLAPLYTAADVFVMPTLEDNWSLVVPEAMACGLPVLCSVYNGCWPELVHHGRNGWTFDPLDTAQLAKLLNYCAASVSELPAMGAASRDIIAQQTATTAAQSILDACHIALASR
jgi:glycosyltransferase involved in cell wall biosynthesis